MKNEWVIVEAHQMFQLKNTIKTFYKTNNVDTSLNSYGVLTITVDGKIVAEINSVKTLTWRVSLPLTASRNTARP